MKVFAISDLHLSINNPKPMDIFGPVWENAYDKITQNWQEIVRQDDIVLLCGDFRAQNPLASKASDSGDVCLRQTR